MPPLTIPPGVVTGENLKKLFDHARDNGYAIPAVNISSSSTANAVMEAAMKANSPVIIQVSQGGAAFIGGKSLEDDKATLPISAAGSIAIALHIRAVAPFYGIPVVVHSDHCTQKLLPWFDKMLEADKAYFDKFGEPLFSSHMLDLSEKTDQENIEICAKYFREMVKINLMLEMKIGITGGEEDGVNNEGIDPENLCTTPEQVYKVYEALSKIGPLFSMAAAFGSVHGVYRPGNVKLSPKRLSRHQAYIKEKIGSSMEKPIYFVMHGGSGSTEDEIDLAVKNGVVKVNIDTDTQWAYWDGLRSYEAKNKKYLQGQIGNPEGPDKPNKSKYDPRKFIRAAEESMCDRVIQAFVRLGTTGMCGKEYISWKATEPEPNALSMCSVPPPAPIPLLGALCAAGVIIGYIVARTV